LFLPYNFSQRGLGVASTLATPGYGHVFLHILPFPKTAKFCVGLDTILNLSCLFYLAVMGSNFFKVVKL